MNIRTIRRLLGALKDAQPPLITAVAAVNLVQNLAPAAAAVATALLIGRVEYSSTAGLFGATLIPIGGFALVLGAGHIAEALSDPLTYLAIARIDGAHRARIIRLAASSPTVDALEDPETQKLIRATRADRGNWTERTPGTGALALAQVTSILLGVAASCLVLTRYAWWLVPLLVIPALAHWYTTMRQQAALASGWRKGTGEGLHAFKWERTVVSPAEAKEIRIFGFGDWLVERIQKHILGMFEPVWLTVSLSPARQLLFVGIPLTAAFGLVANGTAHGHNTVGVEAAVFAAGWSVFQALGWNDSLLSIVSAGECLDAYESLVSALSAPEKTSMDVHLSAVSSAQLATDGTEPLGAPLIRFEDVSFSYRGSERTILDRLNLEIRPGELLAIVGINGAGKSTLIKLLAALYEPSEGRITCDGTNIADLSPDMWRRNISVVFQGFVRYQLTAADNVALGQARVPSDLAAIEEATKDAGFGDVVQHLPKGWDTPLARARTGGVDLSGGQWQLLVLTRALYALRKGAKLLVLDEPTAHLDVRTEFDVFGRLARRKSNASVVLISHRLSTVRHADRIVLLDRGRITESGSHAELMHLNGKYAEMFTIQAERFNSGYDDRNEEGELL